MNTKLMTIACVILFANTVFAATFSAGHADIGLGEHDELELHLHIHEGSIVDGSASLTDGEYEPSLSVIIVPNSTMFSRPAGTGWDLIGNNAGDNSWILPESESDAESMGAPFLGFGAHIDKGTFIDNEIILTLTGVNGPGYFSLYNVSLASPTFEMSSFDGISAADSILVDLDIKDHAHFNFGFSQIGLYHVSFEVSAINAATQQAVSDTGTFTFHVVPEPATLSLLAFGGIALAKKNKNKKRV